MEIIKTGCCIDGIEVTSEHIGKNLVVLKTYDDQRLPVGFVTTIKNVYGGVVDLQDAGGEYSCYDVELDSDYWEFEWVEPINLEVLKKEASTKPQRMRIAETIRDAKAALDLAVSAAEEAGMKVSISNDGVKITFNPPVEEY